MAFKGEIDGEEVTVSFYGNAPEFHCPLLATEGKRFDSQEKLEAAIKAYKLSLRKDFKNTSAWHFNGWRSTAPRPCTVTSVTENGKEAWIRFADGSRSKVGLDTLTPDKDALLAVTEFEQKANQQVKDAWAALPRWKPERS